MSINDGGPIYPNLVDDGPSIRGHFAGLAMNGILSNQSFDDATKEEVAGMSYEIADAMIRAREAGQ